MRKILSSMLVVPLLLVGCGKEEPVPQQVVQQPPVEKESLHFSLKDDNDSGFQIDIQEPEGLTEEFMQQVAGGEGQVTAEIGKPPEGSVTEVGTPPQNGMSAGGQMGMEAGGNGMSLPSTGTGMDAGAGMGTGMNGMPSLDGSSSQGQDEGEAPPVEYPPSTVEYKEIPVEFTSDTIQEWVEEKKTTKGGYAKEDGNRLFLLVAAGERPHTGFKVKVGGVYEMEKSVEFHFELEEAKAGTLQIPKTPYLLVSMPLTSKNIEFFGDL